LRIADMIPMQGRKTRPLQTIVNWSSSDPILILNAGNVRTTADYDSATGSIGKQNGRHSSACRTTYLKRHW